MKRTRIRRQSKSEWSGLIRDCDEIFREIIRKRDVCCQKTDKVINLQVAHFFSRDYKQVRWDEENACLLNKGVHYFWAHSRYEQFRDWWISRIGKEKFDRLKLRSRVKGTIYTSDLKVMKLALQKRLDNDFNK